MVRRRHRLLAALGLATATLVVATPAYAQSANVLDQIVAQFQARSAGWEGALRSFAMGTFGILAGVEIAWAGFRLAFRGADVSEWLAEIVNQILFLGFFLALLENSVTWGQVIVNSFRQAANAAGGGGIAPSDVFAAGVKIASMVLNQMSIWHPEASAGLMLAGIVIEVCFALMAAFMVLALVESFLIISMGVLLMAFGGSRWTKDLAVSTVRYTVSVGAKLFVLQLLVSIGTGLIQDWANSFTDVTDVSLCILIGCAIVMLALVKVLPETMQRIVTGSSMAGVSALVGAAAAVSGAVGVAGLGMLGAGPMMGNSVRLAGAQMDAADTKAAEANGGDAPQRSRISRAAAMTGYTARNLVSAPLADVGRRLSGQHPRHGLATWRMSADLANQHRLLQEDTGKPAPPPGGGGNTLS
ncbi:P-type conjugative transfer protein TrbL [Limobrevibacterium gyesilva]|uniref:P-type conjugative transfer protein TrbL n=1 Tax=Limobrevibacterium gyesilva TaxID=2991712 RepID=A0AA42CGF8_9PROT|nr:P-type conjugative transfer protein TrbL [Limobrevibacterium gyesilva]MCW3477679.1 P-type conjugative transfer protein TrbL [Limobrevibacterium gyesilva]